MKKTLKKLLIHTMELIAIKTAITIKKYVKKEEHITQNCSEVIACNAKQLFFNGRATFLPLPFLLV